MKELLTVLFLKGFIQSTPETEQDIQKLAAVGYIKQEGDHWIENKEVTDKILYPNQGKSICGYCRRQGDMGAFSPYCGTFCNNDCLVGHARTCRACGISLAMEK